MRILVFRIGQLGDSLIALPALWAIRENFPDAELTLLCDAHSNVRFIGAGSVFEGTGLFTDVITYPISQKLLNVWKFLRDLRRRHFDAVVYLAPSDRTPRQRSRDGWFFRLGGIQKRYGFGGFPMQDRKSFTSPLPHIIHESDQLLSRLRHDGLNVPAAGSGRFEICLNDNDQQVVDQWLSKSVDDHGRTWVGVGPGSKMPSKIWPEERFQYVIQQLIDRFQIWPVVFGGPEDRATAERLIENWGCGHNAAGSLGIRHSIAALNRCRLFIGNDTGTLHMAVAAGTQCLGIFSSRDLPGKWYPYGHNHRVFRTDIACEGCMLTACTLRNNECLRSVSETDVAAAATEILSLALSPHESAS